MSTSVLFNPAYNDVAYPEQDTVLGSILATSLTAYTDINNNKYNITVGASSNVDLEAINNVNVFFSSGNAFNIYETVASSNSASSTRKDSLLLNVVNTNSVTHLTTSHTPMALSGADASNTTSVGNATFYDDGHTLNISTSLVGGVEFLTNTQCSGTFLAQKGVVSLGNIASVNSFAQTMNLYRNYTPSADLSVPTAVGYSFNINANGMLELIQYHQTSTDSTGSVVATTSKRVAAWGSLSDTLVTHSNTSADYGVLRQFLGVLPTNSNVNGYVQGVSSGGIQLLSSTSTGDVYVSSLSNNFGVGLSNPAYSVDVSGTIRSSVSMISPTYLTISDMRLKENIKGTESVDFLGLMDDINVFRYNMADDTTRRNRFGWIAQELRGILPEAVLENPHQHLSNCLQVDTDILLAVLFGAFKQLKNELREARQPRP